MVERKTNCQARKYKSKNESKIEKLTEKHSFAQIDTLGGKKYLHYGTFQAHPGTIGQRLLYENACLNGCSYYKRFIEETPKIGATSNEIFKTRGPPEKDTRPLKPQIPKKKKKIDQPTPSKDALEIVLSSIRPKVKSGINPYVPKLKKEKQRTAFETKKIFKQNYKRHSRLEEISKDPTIIGLPQVELKEFNYNSQINQTPQYDLLFENENEIYIFALRSSSHSKSKPKSKEKPKITLKTTLNQEIEKFTKKYPDKIIHALIGNEYKIIQKKKWFYWETILFDKK